MFHFVWLLTERMGHVLAPQKIAVIGYFSVSLTGGWIQHPMVQSMVACVVAGDRRGFSRPTLALWIHHIWVCGVQVVEYVSCVVMWRRHNSTVQQFEAARCRLLQGALTSWSGSFHSRPSRLADYWLRKCCSWARFLNVNITDDHPNVIVIVIKIWIFV